VSHVALITDKIFDKFEVRQSICFWLLVFYCWYVNYVTRRPWPLTLWPRTFTVYQCHVTKFCTKFEWNPTSHGWAIAIYRLKLRALFAIMKLTGCGFFLQTLRPFRVHSALSNFNIIDQCDARFLMIKPIDASRFSGGQQSWGDLYQI